MGKGFVQAAALFAAVLALTGPGRADDCARTPCRPGGFLVLERGEGMRTTSVAVPHSPYVLADGTIQVFPGETLVFRLPVDGDKVGTPVFVGEYAPIMPAERDPQGPSVPERDLPKLTGHTPEAVLAAFPEGTFIVAYGQMQAQPGMNLIMMHNLPRMVKLDAFMTVLTGKGNEPQPTTTCPIQPKLFGLENWPHPIGAMLLKNLRFLPEGASMSCD